jgi:hypothetical protein
MAAKFVALPVAKMALFSVAKMSVREVRSPALPCREAVDTGIRGWSTKNQRIAQ